MNILKFLDELNDKQREAVLTTEGPVLVLAGAGSGKTKVLTYRVAYILARNLADSENILALTFTNKAAGEMKERIRKILGNLSKDIWIHTFHAMCLRILKQHSELIGYPKNFVVYDRDDQFRIIRSLIKDKDLKAGEVLDKLMDYKAKLIENLDSGLKEIYEQYNEKLRLQKAMDFEDLMLNTLKLFNEHPEIRDFYAKKFKYIHVDEYQDTNHIQYQLLRNLLLYHNNIFAVGDEDQSIYSFRGADFRIILNFEKDFPNAKIIFLEQNYRSTKKILLLANRVIKHNVERRDKVLWTNNPDGKDPEVLINEDEIEEAEKIAKIITHSKRAYSDFAILFRINAISKSIEEVFNKYKIPYNVIGGEKFYERREIKDLISYLRLIHNPADNVSLERAINTPPRGIGETTMEIIKKIASENNVSYFEALRPSLKFINRKSAIEGIIEFLNLFEKLREYAKHLSVKELAKKIIIETKYIEYIQKNESTKTATERIENIEEFINSLDIYESLEEFIEDISVRIENEADIKNNSVSIMTIHAAKGLEFPVVFVIGLEEDILPHKLSIEEGNLEEERRLFYVSITRAKEELYLSYSKVRFLKGRQELEISRFLKEAGYKDGKLIADSYPDTLFKYRIGDIVKHHKFGIGKILEIKDDKIKVLFNEYGVKILISHLAKLERITK
ncbi:MAG: UvrD-helicase domain-containing protein [candidate division WOR-3 bacterium]|jgi:DNA helicase-2/ATP-dependent DNA helicase PcrA